MRGETIMRIKPLLVVFPLILSLFAFSISSFAESHHPYVEILHQRVPVISGAYFPVSTPSVLTSSRSRHQVPLWHDPVCLQFLQRIHQPRNHAPLIEIVPSLTISQVALETTVMRC